MKLNALGAALLLGCATLSQAQEAPKPPPQEAPKPTFTFALKGFVSMSAAYQSGAFNVSEGQQSLDSATGVNPVHDKDSLTFDVRQSRFNFSVQGPKVLNGATPTGVLEIDFFQGQGGGRYGDVSLLNRLRLAYSELNWGAHRLLFGQNNDLVFAMAPMSLSHIAFPLGYYTGNIGWRRPGIFGYHTFALPNDLKLEGAWEVGRSQWADLGGPATAAPVNGIGAASTGDPGGISLGEASGAPAVEGRVTLGYSKLLSLFAAAHWNQVDLTGYSNGNAVPAGAKHHVNTVAYNAGLKFTLPLQSDMLLTIQGTGFTGQNVAPLIANFTTGAAAFRVGPLGEDVSTMGWWAQAGFNFTKELSLWAFYGGQAMDKKDFVRAGQAGAVNTAYENATTNIQAIYRDGGFGFSVEWINFATKYATAVDVPALTVTGNRTAKSDQYMFTANYFF